MLVNFSFAHFDVDNVGMKKLDCLKRGCARTGRRPGEDRARNGRGQGSGRMWEGEGGKRSCLECKPGKVKFTSVCPLVLQKLVVRILFFTGDMLHESGPRSSRWLNFEILGVKNVVDFWWQIICRISQGKKGLNSEECQKPQPPLLLKKVSQYTSNLYCNTPPISLAVLLVAYALKKGNCHQYSSHLYRSTPPICIAIRLSFVSQYFWEVPGGCGHRDVPHKFCHRKLHHIVHFKKRNLSPRAHSGRILA